MKKFLVIFAFIAIFSVCGCKKSSEVNNIDATAYEISSIDSSISENNSNSEKADISDGENIFNDNSVNDNSDNEASPSSSEDKLSNFDKRVLCYGTSLTYGTGGEGVTMPGVLGRLSGATVMNYGGYAENTNCIATRSGASKLTLTKDITVPSDDTPVEICFESEFGDIVLILKYTDAGLNPVTIDGITGKLSITEDDVSGIHYYFNRFEAGESKQVKAGTVIVPYSVTDKNPSDIIVIWTAGNDKLQNTSDIEALIDKIDKMIEFSGCDKYIVLSEANLHAEVPVTDEVNEMFENHYTDHFLNFRKYLINDAFSDLGLYPSPEDEEDISAGEIPRYFRIDEVHGNSLYYYLAGTMVYKKCQELGYLK